MTYGYLQKPIRNSMHIRIDAFQPKAIAYFPSTLTPYRSPGLPTIGWTMQAFWYSQNKQIPGACFGLLFTEYGSARELPYETFLQASGSDATLLNSRENIHRLRNGKTYKGRDSTLKDMHKYYGQELPQFNQVSSFLQEMIENPLPSLPGLDGWYRQTTRK
jgi:hypothetical protein